MSSVTFTFPLNPPLTKGDLWQDLVLHCFAIAIVASRSWRNRLEISILCPTIEDKSQDLPSFFYGSGGRTCVLSHIYNPSKPPFKCTSFLFVATARQNKRVCSALVLIATLKRRACGKTCLALLRNLKHSHIVAEKSVRNFDVESFAAAVVLITCCWV